MRDWGSTARERADAYPCDRFLVHPDEVLHRAVDVEAPPDVVFRWLGQLRVAPYSYDWIDNFGRRSPRTLADPAPPLADGQRFMRIFHLVHHVAGREITLVLDDPRARRVFGDLALTYRVTPSGGGTRLLARLLVRRPRGAFGLLAPLLPLGDLVMMRKQLLTLKELAEGRSPG